MSEAELTWLAEQAASHVWIVEIGSYKGRSTRALADNTHGTVIAIDDFKGPREIEVNRNGILEEYRRNTNSCRNLITLVQDHREQYIGPGPDMVFIDGAHDYESVLADIIHWSRLLQVGGLICGHDYGTNWPGVDRAVNQIFEHVERGPDSIWIGR